MAAGSIAIIGGGVIGVCSAYYLAKDGWQVTLVEKDDIAAGASYGNAGLVVPSHLVPLAAPGVWVQGIKWMRDPESPFYIKPRANAALTRWLWDFRAHCNDKNVDRGVPVLGALSRLSFSLYEELAQLPGLSFGFEKNGVIMTYLTRAAMDEARHEIDVVAASGASFRELDGDALRALEPAASKDVYGGFYFEGDGHIIPGQFVTGLAGVVEGMGVKILRHTEVLGVRTSGGSIGALETTRGDVEADQYVLAAGAWSPALTRGLKLRVPVQPAKGYSITWRRPSFSNRIPLLLGEARASITPMGDTLRIAGTLELAGMDQSINRRRVNALRRKAAKYIPGLDQLEPLEIWRGLRPCTPDGLPIIGRSRKVPNLVLATGHAMVGMSLGTGTGKLVAEIAARETPSVDTTEMAPERF